MTEKRPDINGNADGPNGRNESYMINGRKVLRNKAIKNHKKKQQSPLLFPL